MLHGWRQREAANALGLSVQRLRALAHGTCPTVDVGTLLRIAHGYTTAIEAFLYEDHFLRATWRIADVFAQLGLFLHREGIDDALALARAMVSSDYARRMAS